MIYRALFYLIIHTIYTMNLSQLKRKVDNLIISDEDIGQYKNYLERKTMTISKWADIDLIEDPTLDKVYSVASWFSSNLELGYLKDLLINELGKTTSNFEWSVLNSCLTFFSLIFEISNIDEELVNRLYELYNVSFDWKYAFYLVEWNFKIDNINESLIKNLNEFRLWFLKKARIKDLVILPYFFRDHYYYILHYNESKKNSFMEWYFLLNNRITTKKSCIFFFWEDEKTKQIYLVIKQLWKTKINESIIWTFNKLLRLNVNFNRYPIWNFQTIDWWQGIKEPANRKLNLKKVDLYSLWYDNVVSFLWEDVIKDVKQFRNTNKINVVSTNIQYECRNEITKKEIGKVLTWEVTKYIIDYEINNQKLWYFLSLLQSSWVIQEESAKNFKTKYKIIIDCLLSWECFIKNEADEIWEISEFISKITCVSNWKSMDINLKEVSFKHMFVKGEKHQWSIVGNMKLSLKLDELFRKKIDWCIDFERCSLWNVSKFSFPGTKTKYLKWVIILFAHKIEDILGLLKEQEKYIIFLEDEKINGSFVKELISKNIISKIYGIKSSEELLVRGKEFIKESIVWHSYISEDIIDIDIIAKSWSWDEFEDAVSLVLESFLSRYIPLWKWIRWISLPDWMILENWRNIFYDAKSSKNIFEYLWSEELRKFQSYIDFFPNGKENLFICFGPNISDNDLKKIEQRTEMKKILDWWHKILYVWSDCLDFLYKIKKHTLFKNAWKFIDTLWLSGLFIDSCNIWKFSQLSKEKLKNDFIKYSFSTTYDDILKKIDTKTESKIDYKWEIEAIKKYASTL